MQSTQTAASLNTTAAKKLDAIARDFDDSWVKSRLAIAPGHWRARVGNRYARLKKTDAFTANTWLREITDRMKHLIVRVNASDAEICHRADDFADYCFQKAGTLGAGCGLEMHLEAERFCRWRGVEPPSLGLTDADVAALKGERLGCTARGGMRLYSMLDLLVLFGADKVKAALLELTAPALARMTDPLWWRRRIRQVHARMIESHAMALGYIHKRDQKYVSDLTVTRRQQQKKRTADMLSKVDAINQHGEVITLGELAERSNANPRVRRSELMTRVKGLENIARALQHIALFVTLTAPSRYHAMGGDNPKFDGSTPRQAQAWLRQTWERLRAWYARKGIEVYGLRVAEPHQDGCPHWHLLLFMAKQYRARFMAKFRRYAMRTDDNYAAPPDVAELARKYKAMGVAAYRKKADAALADYWLKRRIATRRDENADIDRKRHGMKFVDVAMTEAQSAAGYIVKYISKNIDGYQVQLDLYGDDAVAGSARIEAWASAHGTRQFQFLGGAPVGEWRELRRVDEAEGLRSESLDAARQAADDGKWDDYVMLQGGPTVKRKDLRLRLAKTRAGEKWDGANQCTVPAMATKYGEMPAPSVIGVRDVRRDTSVITRRYTWRIQQQTNTTERGPLMPAVAARKLDSDWRVPTPPAFVIDEVVLPRDADGRPNFDGFKLDFEGLGVEVFPWTRVNNCTPPLAADTKWEQHHAHKTLSGGSVYDDDDDFDALSKPGAWLFGAAN